MTSPFKKIRIKNVNKQLVNQVNILKLDSRKMPKGYQMGTHK